jgi:hypothetical protein
MVVHKAQARRKSVSRTISQTTRERRWQEAISALLKYRKQYGDCCVPSRWPKNRRLARWVEVTRAAKKQHRLSSSQIQQLDKIGFVWSFDPRQAWDLRFKELEAFKKKHGHCNVPRSYRRNQPLAYWVDSLRRKKRQGKLERKTASRLNALGFAWSVVKRRFHRRNLDELVVFLGAFKKRHGHCDIQAAHEGVGADIMDWLKDVRKSKKQGRLDPRHARQLDRLGFVWQPKQQFPRAMQAALAAYRKQHGDCLVPADWPENRRLASWVERMRSARRRKLLTADEIAELDRIGFAWENRFAQAWEEHFQQLEKFQKKHKHCRVPRVYAAAPALPRWVATMRRQKRLGKLASERTARLNTLGLDWTADAGKRPRKTEPAGRKPKKKARIQATDSSSPGGSARRQTRRSAAKRRPLRRTSRRS